MLPTILQCAYLVSYSYQINFPGWGWVAGLTEIKANSASQQRLSWGLVELGNMTIMAVMIIMPVMHWMAILALMVTMAVIPIYTVIAASCNIYKFFLYWML